MKKKLNECFVEESKTTGTPIEKIREKDFRPIYIRQVACADKNFPVRERMLKRYAKEDYPPEFPCRSKCVILFQNLDGVDVILFAMYVYEYGHQCRQPNQRRVYISYLDSVHYFRPRRYRTVIYHEILIQYLKYVKQRGFHTAHIWACPPFKGDDYILYAHPQDQKVPKDDRLKKWYMTMLEEAHRVGIVAEITTLFDENFTNPENNATVLPYMEGDYWIGEAENLIKEIDEDEEADDLMNPNVKSKSKKKKGSKSNKKKTTETTETTECKDLLMRKLGSVLFQMRESFIVAKLRPNAFIKAMGERLEQEKAATGKQVEDETLDVDPQEESEIFDTRSDFLEFCRVSVDLCLSCLDTRIIISYAHNSLHVFFPSLGVHEGGKFKKRKRNLNGLIFFFVLPGKSLPIRLPPARQALKYDGAVSSAESWCSQVLTHVYGMQ